MLFQFPVFLHSFRPVLPPYRVAQSDSLEWLTEAYAIATRGRNAKASSPDDDENSDYSRGKFQKMVQRFSCPSTKIGHRYSFLSDYTHTDWEKMNLFRLRESPRGGMLSRRMELFSEAVQPVVDQVLEDKKTYSPLREILHVSCTGYESPSAPQRWAAKWRPEVKVTHAYHMGCYAALPAVRMAALTLSGARDQEGQEIEIVHTELCSLHFDPTDCSPSQIVVQSLFGDGVIAYTASNQKSSRSLELLAETELLLPDTSTLMTWVPGEYGMQMTLSRDVPDRILYSIRPFLDSLFSEVHVDYERIKGDMIFAVHPGGPRIVEGVQDALRLNDDQLRFSRKILHEHGNMSSATIPHIWKDICESDSVRGGTYIVSLAFGPGLTVCGALLRKSGV